MSRKYLTCCCTLKLDKSLCRGCGKCIEVCPHNVFQIKGGCAEIVNKDNCMECGACKKNCAFSAISVKSGVGCVYGIVNKTIN